MSREWESVGSVIVQPSTANRLLRIHGSRRKSVSRLIGRWPEFEIEDDPDGHQKEGNDAKHDDFVLDHAAGHGGKDLARLKGLDAERGGRKRTLRA